MKNIETLKFKHFCMTIGNLPSSYVESLSYYECLMWLCKYLQDTVIPTVNNNAEAVVELQGLYLELKSYVDNYFENLDVQEEINNKLDDMVEQGTLQEIIADYLNSKAVFGFDTVADMKEATNLINGSYAQTLGFYSKNDGGSALYKIREITNDDVVDEQFIIALADDELIAELIIDGSLNIKQCGVVADGTTDDTTKIKNVISKAKTDNYKITANKNDVIVVSETLDVSNLYLDFNMAEIKTSSKINIFTINSTTYYGEIKNVTINCNGTATAGIHIENGKKQNIIGCNIINIKTYGIYYKEGYELTCDTLNLQGTTTDNSTGIYATSGDSNFNNIIMIDCKTAIHNVNGSNYYTNIHAWILTSGLLAGSIFYKCNAGSCFLTNCYSDTYQYSIYQYTQIPRLEIVNMFNVYNHGIYTSEIATSNQPVFFYCESSNGDSLSRISNSTLDGYSSEIKTKLTNLTSFNGDIVNSRITNFDYILPFNNIGTGSNTAGVSVVTSTLEKTNKCVYLMERASMDATSTKTFVIGTIPYYFRPNVDYIGICSYGTGQYNVQGVGYVYIANTGNITVTLPDSATGNVTVKLNITFLTHKEL